MSGSSLIIHCRRAPYGTSLARAAIELVMAAAVFDQSVAVLFSGDGVWQLLDRQQTDDIEGEKNHGKLLSALPVYGVTDIYVDSAALAARSLSLGDLCLPVAPLDKTELSALLNQGGQVLTF